MPLKKPARRAIGVALASLAVGAVAAAAASPLTLSVNVFDGILNVSTNALPRGWFSTRNALDREKTQLVTAWSLGSTSCSLVTSSAPSLSSATQGNFSPALSPSGQVTAYYWDTTVDLSAQRNHWYLHHHCDGTTEVHGCAEAIPVTVTMTAYNANGECLTYQNDSGETVCVSDTQVTSLPAVQDPDVTDSCSSSCGIGPCVSACEHSCSALSDREAREACKRGCPCECKQQLPASCPPHDECD